MPTTTRRAALPVMRLPRAWRALLAIEDLGRRRTPVRKYVGTASLAAHARDPKPYADDFREVTRRVGAFTVTALLMSGQTNYWLDWRVVRTATGAIEFADGAGDVDFSIASGQEMTLASGGSLEFRVQIR